MRMPAINRSAKAKKAQSKVAKKVVSTGTAAATAAIVGKVGSKVLGGIAGEIVCNTPTAPPEKDCISADDSFIAGFFKSVPQRSIVDQLNNAKPALPKAAAVPATPAKHAAAAAPAKPPTVKLKQAKNLAKLAVVAAPAKPAVPAAAKAIAPATPQASHQQSNIKISGGLILQGSGDPKTIAKNLASDIKDLGKSIENFLSPKSSFEVRVAGYDVPVRREGKHKFHVDSYKDYPPHIKEKLEPQRQAYIKKWEIKPENEKYLGIHLLSGRFCANGKAREDVIAKKLKMAEEEKETRKTNAEIRKAVKEARKADAEFKKAEKEYEIAAQETAKVRLSIR